MLDVDVGALGIEEEVESEPDATSAGRCTIGLLRIIWLDSQWRFGFDL